MFKLIPLQLDVNTAYVWSDINEPIYLRAFPGFKLDPGKCWRLLKSLYGMPQSGRNWNQLFTEFLITFEFIPLREDLCLFVLYVNGKIVAIIVIYVDDVLAGFDSEARRDWFITIISGRFDVKVLGLPTNLLGLKLEWTPIEGELYFSAVKITNTKSVTVLVNYFDLNNTKSVTIPYNVSATLSKSQCPSASQREDSGVIQMQNDYRMAVGTFIWLQCTTRPDIMPIVLVLSQFVANPWWPHYEAMLWLIKYLKATIDLGICYSFDSDQNLLGYVDADHASHEDRRSRYCHIFMLAGGPIFWKNGFEKRFSLSTAESEVRAIFALREAIKHICYLRKVFTSLHLPTITDSAALALVSIPQIIYEDNAAAIRFAFNPASQSTMKYLETDILWIHEAIERKEFTLLKIESSEQLADIGTKLNRSDIFLYLRSRIMR
jgi:hypothetical protein